MAFGIIAQMLFQILDELAAFGARADEAHFALQHGPGLRQFVDPQFAQPIAKPGDARIVLFRPDRLSIDFRIGPHGAQLHDPEFLAEQADTLLPVESRPLAVQLHQYRRDQDDRAGQRQQQRTGQNIEQSLGEAGYAATGGKAVRKDQPAGIDAGEVDAPCLPLQKGRQIVDMDAGGLDPQKVRHRDGVAPFLQRQHHFAGVQADDEIGQVIDGAAVDRFLHHLRPVIHGDIANDEIASALLLFQFADAIGAIARAEHDKAPLESFAAQHRAEHQPDRQ